MAVRLFPRSSTARNWHAPPAPYTLDFGDDWEHVLVHEGMESVTDDRRYPRCVSGERRCSPEDCGGVHGYAEFLQVVADPASRGARVDDRVGRWHFDPEVFDPGAVKFDDPRKRLKKAFKSRP